MTLRVDPGWDELSDKLAKGTKSSGSLDRRVQYKEKWMELAARGWKGKAAIVLNAEAWMSEMDHISQDIVNQSSSSLFSVNQEGEPH